MRANLHSTALQDELCHALAFLGVQDVRRVVEASGEHVKRAHQQPCFIQKRPPNTGAPQASMRASAVSTSGTFLQLATRRWRTAAPSSPTLTGSCSGLTPQHLTAVRCCIRMTSRPRHGRHPQSRVAPCPIITQTASIPRVGKFVARETHALSRRGAVDRGTTIDKTQNLVQGCG